jgi:hypothetical protein
MTTKRMTTRQITLTTATLLLAACWLSAQESNTTAGSPEDEAAKQAELAKKTLNPVANLISVPIRNN